MVVGTVGLNGLWPKVISFALIFTSFSHFLLQEVSQREKSEAGRSPVGPNWRGGRPGDW